jgi:SDR family mycofactocin-dependent oxidoreductase
MGRMDGKVALITGAARGQGRAHALRLAAEGADVVAVDICSTVAGTAYRGPSPADLEETAALVRGHGRRALARQADVRDTAALADVVHEAVDEFGQIDTVCANAGISFLKPAWELTDDDWQQVIDINLTGAFKTARAAIPQMIEHGRGGSLIFIGSVAGLVGIPNVAHYTASKHGVVGLMRSLAAELAPYDIRVNAVHPGTVRTPMIDSPELFRQLAPRDGDSPTARVMKLYKSLNALPVAWIEPDDVSGAVLFLASEDARYITGVEIPVDAGMSMPMKVPHVD